MRSKLYETYGQFKVWHRPATECFEVRQGNKILFRSLHLHIAMMDAKARMNAFWDEQARVMNELKAKGEL